MPPTGLMSMMFRVSTLPGRMMLRGLGLRFERAAEADRRVTQLIEEIEAAQQQAFLKIQTKLRQADAEIEAEPRAAQLTPAQREQLADRLLQLSEEQLLEALANIYKALRVLAPRRRELPDHSARN